MKYSELSRENMITSPFPHMKRSPSLWLHNKLRLLQQKYNHDPTLKP